jgi:predicted dehydrogenase
MIRVGVIGLGFMGATHISAYQRAAKDGFPCRLAAVADRRSARRAGQLWDVGGNAVSDTSSRELAFDPSAVKGYETSQQLLADPEIDLVSICTPTDTHVELGIAALQARKHVLMEKPVALKTQDAQRLADVAKESGKLCMPAMCMRFWPAWKWLKDRIDDRSLGNLDAVTFTRLSTAPTWNPNFYANGARSGGALFDLHIHDADFVRFCFGQPTSVNSTGYAGASSEIDHVVTSYRFARADAPRYVVAEGGWDQHAGFAFRMRYVARFEQATADFDLTRSAPLLLCHNGRSTPVNVDDFSGYDGQVRHLIDTITHPERSLIATMTDAVEVTRLLQAERESIRSARSVVL